MTYIEKVEAAVEECKQWLIHEFGEHMSIHNAFSDLKGNILKASSTLEASGEEKKPDETPQP